MVRRVSIQDILLGKVIHDTVVFTTLRNKSDQSDTEVETSRLLTVYHLLPIYTQRTYFPPH